MINSFMQIKLVKIIFSDDQKNKENIKSFYNIDLIIYKRLCLKIFIYYPLIISFMIVCSSSS